MADLFAQVERWRKVWARGERVRLPLQSNDMEPYVRAGDTIEFSEARLLDLHRNDFVLIYIHGNVRLRRLADRFITPQGERFVIEACNVADSRQECGFEDILAKAELVARGNIQLWKRGEALLLLRWRRYWHRRKLS